MADATDDTPAAPAPAAPAAAAPESALAVPATVALADGVKNAVAVICPRPECGCKIFQANTAVLLADHTVGLQGTCCCFVQPLIWGTNQ